MVKALLGLVAGLLLSPGSSAAADSLMFSDEERAALRFRETETSAEAPSPSSSSPKFHLAAIVPATDGGWVARLGDRWLGEGDHLGALQVERIEARAVHLLWSGGPRVSRFTLQPNQTIDLSTGHIREGR